MSDSVDRDELTQFICQYSGDFKTATVADMGQYFCSTVTTIHNDVVSHYSDSGLFVDSLILALKPLVETGFSHTVLDDIYIHPLREHSVLVSANFRRLDNKGQLFSLVGASYILVHTEQGYKIASIMGHDIDKLITAE